LDGNASTTLSEGGAGADQDVAGEPTPSAGRLARRGLGLSAKLLLLTLGFVMLAEVLIFVPSIANFRYNWLMDRLQAAQIASLAAEAAPNGKLPEMLREQLLMAAQVRGIAVKFKIRRLLVMAEDMPPTVDQDYDLTTTNTLSKIMDAVMVFMHPEGRTIRVAGEPPIGNHGIIEVVMSETPLRQAMVRFGLSILGLSLLISGITAGLVYLALNWLLVRPMRRLTENVIEFAHSPEDGRRIITPSGRRDELGRAEHALASMQTELRDMLQHKSHLAALGLAVSKISHDLRNTLASAQLISDRIGMVKDPTVERATPKLISSLDRAIRLCQDTLQYGRAREPVPQRQKLAVRLLAEEVGESLGLPRAEGPDFQVKVPHDLVADADQDQLFRILSNLCRNALQAIEAQKMPGGVILVHGHRNGAGTIIEVGDTGPGIPKRALANLFVPFEGGVRIGGTGLGLAIVHELTRAHGGTVELARTGPDGSTFRIVIPDGGAR
jgi:signal transduction histidine kinase